VRPVRAKSCIRGLVLPDATRTVAGVNSPTALIARPDAVALDLPTGSGEAVIRALHARLAALPAVTDAAGFLDDLLERATVSSVCIAADVALPHARTGAVSGIVLAVGRAPGPVAFDANHPGVRLVFMIGTPKKQVTEYLQLVAGLSRLLKKDGVRAALLAAPGEADFRTVLARGLPG
jgi:mannitol/fructose-specific phosphotransferase system IIA component (Ntr-type)